MGRVLVAGLLLAAIGASSALAAPAKLYSAKEGPEAVSIQVIPDGAGYKLVISRSGANGCSIKLQGPANMKGGSLKMVADDQGRACDVQLTPKASYAELLENSCPLHGDGCRIDDLPILQPR
jgi:hypothetical protein